MMENNHGRTKAGVFTGASLIGNYKKNFNSKGVIRF